MTTLKAMGKLFDDSHLYFTKMHGTGNDYLYLNCLEQTLEEPEHVARVLSDRHFGVGADGIVLILPSETADFRMRMFNADGSEAQMCGNAVRCVAKYVYENGLSSKPVLRLETQAGEKVLELRIIDGLVQSVRVRMGAPEINPERIPLNTSMAPSNQVTIDVADACFEAFCVSMGNPHAVIFVDDITDYQVLTLGPQIERHPLFPEKVNVEFVRVDSPDRLTMRVWERGSGETLACGTGAAAACVAAAETKRADRHVSITLPGGVLELEWDVASNAVFKTGPASFVFEGSVKKSFIKKPGTERST